jgi:O-antigen ligase
LHSHSSDDRAARLADILRTAAASVMVIALVLSEEHIFPIDDVGAAFSVILALLSAVVARRRGLAWKPLLPYGAFLGLVITGWALRPSDAAGAEVWRYTWAFLVTASIAQIDRRSCVVVLATLLTSLALVLPGLAGPSSVVDFRGRALSYGLLEQWSGYPELGLLMSLGAGATMALALTMRRWIARTASALLTAGFVCGSIYMGSRSAVVTTLVVLVWVAIVRAVIARRRAALVAIGGAALVAGLLLISPQGRHAAGSAAARLTAAAEFQIRRAGWDTACRMLAARPWTGVGPGRYPAEYVRFSTGSDPTHAYNTILHVGAELGWPGIAVLLVVWVRALWITARAAATTGLGHAPLATHALLAAFMVRSQSEHFLSNLHTSFRLLLLVAVLFGLAEAVSVGRGAMGLARGAER